LKLDQLRVWIARQKAVAASEEQSAFLFYAGEQIKKFQEDPKKMNLTRAQDPPDGQPIGMDEWACEWK
jgi:hypothetical protein